MQIGNTTYSWGAVQRTLHWTLAVMVIGQLLIGDVMLFSSLFASGAKTVPNLWYFVHPTLGVLIGVLMIARLAWRETNPVPAVPQDLTTGKQALSQATHYAFYGLLILNPLIGYLLICTMGDHVYFFRAMIPDIVGKSSTYESLYFWMHLAFGGSIALLVLLHAGAALQHEFLKGDNVLRRMLGFPPMTAERQAVQDDPGEREHYGRWTNPEDAILHPVPVVARVPDLAELLSESPAARRGEGAVTEAATNTKSLSV